MRVPFIARWPRVISSESESNAFGSTIDLLPTFCDAADIEIPQSVDLDGISLMPMLVGNKCGPDEQRGTVFWQMDLYRELQRHYPKPKPYATEVALRGDWKMLAYHGEPVALYNLSEDILEELNVMSDHPELVSSMMRELQAWLAEPRTTWKD